MSQCNTYTSSLISLTVYGRFWHHAAFPTSFSSLHYSSGLLSKQCRNAGGDAFLQFVDDQVQSVTSDTRGDLLLVAAVKAAYTLLCAVDID